MSERKYISPYDHRVQLVTKSLVEHAQLTNETAAKLAVHVLHSLDHIPEKVR